MKATKKKLSTLFSRNKQEIIINIFFSFLFQPMRQIEHNAPGFHYKIYWKMDAPGQNWNIEEIFDWQSSQLQVPDQPTYQRYMIKIGK